MRAKLVKEGLNILKSKTQQQIEDEMIGKWFFQSNNPYNPFRNGGGISKIFQLLSFDGDKINVKEIYPGTKTQLNKKHLFSKFGTDYHYYPVDAEFLENLDEQIAHFEKLVDTIPAFVELYYDRLKQLKMFKSYLNP